MKKLEKIIELPCEESEKDTIMANIREALADNQDYIDGNIVVESNVPEAVHVVIFEGCKNVNELTMMLTM